MKTILTVVRPTHEAPEPRSAHPRRYWLCAAGDDGWPEAAAVRGLWLDGAVVFPTDADGLGTDEYDLSATVVQVEEGDRVTIIDGIVERLEDPSTLARFAAACDAKYGPGRDRDLSEVPVYAVRPDGAAVTEVPRLPIALEVASQQDAAALAEGRFRPVS